MTNSMTNSMTNTLTTQALIDSWTIFCTQITAFLDELGLLDQQLECDHVALRVNSKDAAERLSNHFDEQGKVISNNIINGRPILIFELNQPLQLSTLNIPCIELPYPSDKKYPVEGWEHIELVLPCTAQNCEDLEVALLALVPTLQPVLTGKTDIKVKRSSPQGEHERLANPTIAFKKGNICIKVHPHGIKAVIASEQV